MDSTIYQCEICKNIKEIQRLPWISLQNIEDLTKYTKLKTEANLNSELIDNVMYIYK